jgi:hypothetical protein
MNARIYPEEMNLDTGNAGNIPGKRTLGAIDWKLPRLRLLVLVVR